MTRVGAGLEVLYARRVFHVPHSFLVVTPKAGFVISLFAEEEREAQRGKASHPWKAARKGRPTPNSPIGTGSPALPAQLFRRNGLSFPSFPHPPMLKTLLSTGSCSEQSGERSPLGRHIN